MTKKSFFIILVLSIIVWYISGIVQALLELLVFKTASISFYPSSFRETGYPVALYISSKTPAYYSYSLTNIIFWFIVIYIVWKFLRRARD